MRNAIAILIALTAGSALVGCNSNNSSPANGSNVGPNPIVGPHQSLNWTLTLKSDCGVQGIATEDCIGGYGFTIYSDGKYQVGPAIGPDHKEKYQKGNLKAEDLNHLNENMSAVLSGHHLQAETQGSIEEATSEESTNTIPPNFTVALVQADGSTEETIIRTNGTEMTYRTESLEIANALLGELRDLADKYYSTPFPNACTDSTDALAHLFTTLQTCNTNNDCAYFDPSMNGVDPNSSATITVNACTIVPQLAIGNSNAVTTHWNELQEKLKTAYDTCGSGFKNNCEISGQIQLPGAAPVCQHGVCTAPHS